MMSFNPVRSLFSAVARILHDKSGASAMMVTIALPGLIGFGALGAETGVWFTIKLQNQSAADAAALSAAYEIIAGKTNAISDLTPAASEAATRNGYKGTTPAVVYPYSDDIVSNGVAVTLHQTQGALLAAMFLSNVTVATKAVAVIEVLDNPCILALGVSSTGIEIADFTRLDTPNCSAAANSISRSAIELHGSTSSIAAVTLVTAGEVSLQGNPINPAAPPSGFTVASQVRIGAPSVVDPYGSTLTHSYLTAGMPPSLPQCGSTSSGGVTIYKGNCGIPGTSLIHSSIKLAGNTRISGGWSILRSQTVDLSPGTYWITGNLTVSSSGVLKCSTCDNAKGTGVTIILSAETGKIGAVSMAANAMFNLNAPNSGRFAGVVIVQDANSIPAGTTYPSSHNSVTGAPGATLNGLVYFPNSSLTFHGNPSVTGPKCLVLVVKALVVDQSSSLETRGCAGAGLTNLPTVSAVALAE
jgi:Flp pilus assembly protein TadG